jgi:DNA-binding transcriptional LysR family regulator
VQLDLNLLVVLNALLEEGSVMGAAERLHLSSPAISRSLGRLRKLTGDDILVRAGRTMVPTPYATAIRDEVRQLLSQAHDVPSQTAARAWSRLARFLRLVPENPRSM